MPKTKWNAPKNLNPIETTMPTGWQDVFDDDK